MSNALTALILALTTMAPLAATAQEDQESFDLATMFELGNLVLDTNGDSVPDLVNASLVLGAAPSVTALAAAAEITARLGFETMAMDLPGDGPGRDRRRRHGWRDPHRDRAGRARRLRTHVARCRSHFARCGRGRRRDSQRRRSYLDPGARR